MKKKTLFFALSSLMIICLFAETNGQYKNRIGRMPDEWDTLVKMQSQLKGEAFINLRNYMMGFSDAMYQGCEYLHDIYQGDYYKNWFYNNYLFYYKESQRAMKDFGAGKSLHRRYYYMAGFNRVDKGTRRFTVHDF